ncbi:unnamed protein product [Parnassius mnemosyne]|uniref:Uncharacterized protein n=1 Tax=Parnassius mnemosyne TaxID=213953 RepID=A0AAV1M6G9_9NEOP
MDLPSKKKAYSQKYRPEWENMDEFKGNQEIPFKVVPKDHSYRHCDESEGALTLFIAEHCSILSVDHLGELCKMCFKDSKATQELKLHRTKCTEIMKNVLMPHFRKELLDDIGNQKFSIIMDKSADVSVSKHLGLVIRYYSAPQENIKQNNALQTTSEDLSTLLHLNVNLSKIEKKPFVAEKILKLNFEEEDTKGILMFIKDYVGVEDIGNFLTKNPLILFETVEDLKIRVNYLESKKFKNESIRRIITQNPFWLMFSTIRIDKRLGYYQEKFKLCGSEVRHLATKQPNLITYNLHHIQTNSFVIKEEMGFNDNEVKQLILKKPKLWMISQNSLLERFNYVHNIMKIPHEKVLHYPNILLCRNFKVKQRHIFLEKLGRAQYDTTKENYVPLSALVEDTDQDFCKRYAKCLVDDFNTFLKTM